MNIFVLILLWQHILHLCTLFFVQGGKWTGQSLMMINSMLSKHVGAVKVF